VTETTTFANFIVWKNMFHTCINTISSLFLFFETSYHIKCIELICFYKFLHKYLKVFFNFANFRWHWIFLTYFLNWCQESRLKLKCKFVISFQQFIINNFKLRFSLVELGRISGCSRLDVEFPIFLD
jgi:hypothetical protein